MPFLNSSIIRNTSKSDALIEDAQMKIARILLLLCLAGLPVLSAAQSSGGLDPALLLKPLSDTWPTYSGDYTGRRFSALTQVNRNTVKNLTLSWVARLNSDAGGPQTIVSGLGSQEYTNVNVKGFVLYFDDILYVTSADH